MRRADARGRTRLALVVWIGLAAIVVPRAHAATGTRVTGKVIDSDTQAPIAGAEVEIENTSGGQGYFRAHSNARGEFTIDRVPADRWYTFSVGAAGYADFVLGGWQFPATQRSVELVVPLDRAGALDVRLTRNDDKHPVAGARVTLTQERGATWWEGALPPIPHRFTGADGVVRYEGLRAGAYVVTADVAGLRPIEARNVTLRRGETTRLPIVMQRPATITGRVTLADGTPVAGVPVTARGPGEAVGTTDADGTFAIGDLAPGRYRIDVTADGFQPLVSKESFTLAEGATREGVTLVATPKPPELAFVIEREAFLPDADVKIGVRSFRIDDMDAVLYRMPDAWQLDPARDVRRQVADGDTTGLQRVTSWHYILARGPEWTWREGTLVVPMKLAPGAYVLRGTSGDLGRSLLFFVTDLGLLVKRSGSRVLASIGSLASGDPLPNVRVFAIATTAGEARERGEWTRALAERRGIPPVLTDANGLAIVPTPGGIPATQTKPPSGANRLRVVAVSEGHGIAIADAPLASVAERSGDQVFLYTDRPLYRPGHTIQWKAFARKAAGTRYALPDATRLHVTIAGPDGASLDVPEATLNEHGGADGSIALPEGIALGDWTLTASTGTTSAAATVGVLQYRKPEFSVDVTPDRAVYVNGDEVRFRIAASYFFGAPVFGAQVRYNLFESRIDRAPLDEDADEAEETPGGYGRVLKTGETRTDRDGRADMVFTPERVAYDRRLTLEVEVMDASNRAVSARGAAIVGRGLFRLTVRPRVWVVTPGTAVPLEITTLDHTGKPVAAAVTVDLDQEAWSPLTHRYTRSTRPLATTTVTTDRNGRALVSLAPSPARAGSILIHAHAVDAKGNRITAEASVWAWDENVSDYAYRYPALEAFADRDRYRAGDTVRVLVNTEASNATVLATLEGRDLYETKTIALHGGTGLVTFAIRAEYAPNAFVTVNVRKGREVHARTLEIPIEAERHDLQIALRPDRDHYAPGDTANVDVETRDAHGRPVPAELSMAVVDEAIFSLRPDATPDPHDVFYGRRPNAVTTALAFPSLLLGGADKGGREEPRKNFQDVARWAPVVRTDAEGRARVGLRYPDNLTTWRVTSRGLTDATLVGKAVTKTLVTKDLVARLAGPRFMIPGDQATLIGIVDNRSDRPIADGEASLKAFGATHLGPDQVKFSAPAHGEARTEWPVKALTPGGPARFVFRAEGKTDSDALEVVVPLRPRAVTVRARGGGVLQSGRGTVTVSLPKDLLPGGSTVTLDLSLSPAGMVLAGVDALMAYPYGCTEQTANAILAAASLLRAAHALDRVPPGWEKPADRLTPLVRRLAAAQLDEGGWGWWKPGDFDPYLTVLAMDALAQATALDIDAGEAQQALDRAAGSVPRAIAEARSLDGEAYLFAHLASVVALRPDDGAFTTLKANLGEIADPVYAARADLGHAALALAAEGLASIGRPTQSKELVTLLLSQFVKDTGGLHWTADRDRPSAWFGEDLDATGYALGAMVRVTPQDVRAGDVVRWLAGHRTGLAWRSTRETAPVTMALAEYVAANAERMKAQGRLRVHVSQMSHGSIPIGPLFDRDVTADPFRAQPIRVEAAPSPGVTQFAIEGPAGSMLFYGWDAKALVPSPGPDTHRNATLSIHREYLRSERTEDRRGRPQYLSTPLAPNEKLRVGEQVLVRLTLHATQALEFALIEDPRVAGFEIDALLPEGVDRPYDTNAEEHDDHVAFFVRHLDEGDTVIEYLARPELAGTFTALPTELSGMYEPERLVRGDEETIVVEAKP